MDSDDDLDFALASKAKTKRGRRKNPFSSQSEDMGSSDDLVDSPLHPSQDSVGLRSPIKSPDGGLPTAPPRSRRTGGWADDTIKSGKKRNASSNLIEQERFRLPDKAEIENDFDDDIPIIPDLDELQAAEASAEIAFAPAVVKTRVAMYQELDTDLFKHAAFATLDDVNLQLLTKCLSLEADVKEPDECWTWDLLFTNVSSELHNEWEKSAEDKDLQHSADSRDRESISNVKSQRMADEEGDYFDPFR